MRSLDTLVLRVVWPALTMALSVGPALAQSGTPVSQPTVGQRVRPLAVKMDAQSLRANPELVRGEVVQGYPLRPLPPGKRNPIFDATVQVRGAAGTEAIGLISNANPNFPGITSGSAPPDTVMDVGPNHVVQMVNATFFRVWNKQGGDLSGGALSFGGLWPAADPCNGNLGDPIVVYDHLADRWLLSQFARNAAQTQFWMCIAISQTPTPLPANGFFLYTIEVPAFPDYPKFGVWPDAYYMTSYEGSNLGAFAFERQRMLTGDAAAFVKFTISSLTGTVRDTRLLPADLDGPAPAEGTPGLFFRSVDDQQDLLDPRDRLEVFALDVDWVTPASATFTTIADIDGGSATPLAPFNTMGCNRDGGGFRSCVPEPDSDDNIDALSNRPMMQLKFRALAADDYRMVVNQTIDVSGSIPAMLGIVPAQEVAGVRWYELQDTGGGWSIRQQGTYAAQPLGATVEGDLLHRWMGGAAIDRFGNIALGYSISNDDGNDGVIGNANEVYPGIRFTGRRFDDPLNLIQQGEKVIFNGTAPNGNLDGTVNGQRWGDYSALSVDPADDCTFWYTTHVANGATRIAAFRFDSCAADLRITKTAEPGSVIAGQQISYTVSVTNDGPARATNVTVVDTLPAGVTHVSNTGGCVQAPVGTLTCNLGTLNVGASRAFTIVVLVNANVGLTTLVNTATVSSDQGDLDTDDNTATASTIVEASANLSVTKTGLPDPVTAGRPLTYTLNISNAGPSAAPNVVVIDALPARVSFVNATPSQGACQSGVVPGDPAKPLQCNLGPLASGAAATLTVNVLLNPDVPAGTILVNNASVSSDVPDPNNGNNVATATTTVDTSADVSISKTSDALTYKPSSTVIYRIDVVNNGPSVARSVVVTDNLPAVKQALYQSDTGGCVLSTPTKLTCALGDVAIGETKTFFINVTVKGSPGSVVNEASVTSATADPSAGNNSSTRIVTIKGGS